MPGNTMVCTLIAAIGFAGGVCAQDAASLAPRFEVGRRDRYGFEAEFRERIGEAPERVLVQRGVVRVSVVRVVTGEGATVRLAFEELFASSKTGEEPAVAFEWREGDADATATPVGAAGEEPAADTGAQPAPEGEEPTPLAAAYRALSEATLEFGVARDGEVTSVSGIEDAWRAAAGDESAGTRLLGLFAPGAVETRLESLLRVDSGWPARARSAGETWEIIDWADLTDRARAKTTSTLTLARLSEGAAEIEGAAAVELVFPARDFDPTDFKPTIEEQSGRVRARWDTARGRLLEREETRALRLAVTLDGGLMSSGASVASTLKLTFLGEVAGEGP